MNEFYNLATSTFIKRTEKTPADVGAPSDARAIREEIAKFLDAEVDGKKVGNAVWGVYVFYDYDGEPIYVGQTHEVLRTRIRRHLTNQRTDAVAMNVLDPFEVAEIEIWPLFELQTVKKKDGNKITPEYLSAIARLNSTEYTVFQKVINRSSFKAVLNEKDVQETNPTGLPCSHRARIIPKGLYEARKHPDVRIARRASTIASPARVISERQPSSGLRRTLVTQAKRLQKLATQRFRPFASRLPKRTNGEED